MRRSLYATACALSVFLLIVGILQTRSCVKAAPPIPLKLTVTLDDPASVNNDIWITLIYTRVNGPQVAVFATISSPGHEILEIKDEVIGFKTSYSGKDTYEIQILNASALKADFLVTPQRR